MDLGQVLASHGQDHRQPLCGLPGRVVLPENGVREARSRDDCFQVVEDASWLGENQDADVHVPQAVQKLVDEGVFAVRIGGVLHHLFLPHLRERVVVRREIADSLQPLKDAVHLRDQRLVRHARAGVCKDVAERDHGRLVLRNRVEIDRPSIGSHGEGDDEIPTAGLLSSLLEIILGGLLRLFDARIRQEGFGGAAAEDLLACGG